MSDIPFNQIPASLGLPGTYTEVDNSLANQGLGLLPNRVLCIGQMHDDGSAEPEVLKQIAKENDGGKYFAVDSQLAWMCKRFKKAASFTEVWAIGLEDDGAAVAAEKSVTFTGTATSSGTHHFLVHGNRVDVGVASGDTAGAQAIAFANKVAAGLELLYIGVYEIEITIAGTPADGDYESIFTGYDLGSPVTVTTTRSTTPADNNALATQHAADITTLAATTLAGVVLSAVAATNVVTVRMLGGRAAGAVTHDQPVGATMANSPPGDAHLICKHAGTIGNFADVRLNYFNREDLDAPAGTTVAIAATVSGATDPDAQDALDVIGDMHFTKIVVGWNGSANILAGEAFLLDKFGPTEQKDGLQYVGVVGSFGTLTTIADDRNSKHTVLAPPDGSSCPAPPWEVAAVMAAVDSAESDPARPRQTLPLPGILPAAREDRFTFAERQLLLDAGISTTKADEGGNLLIETLVTTYTQDGEGLPDLSYSPVTRMHTIAAMRYTTRRRFTQKYPRHKLAADGADYGPGQPVMTPSVARGELATLAEEWEAAAWIEDAESFVAALLVQRNSVNLDRLDARINPDIINEFRIFAVQLQFLS
jgi:phage tail sheath gpL-like